MSRAPNHTQFILVVSEKVKVAKVSWSKEEEEKGVFKFYKYLDDLNLQPDDKVVIQTNSRWGLAVGKVIETDNEHELSPSAEIDWIVDRIDTESYEDMLDTEKNIIKQAAKARKQKEREEAKAEMKAYMEASDTVPLLGDDTLIQDT